MAHRNQFSVLTATEKGYVSSRFIMEVPSEDWSDDRSAGDSFKQLPRVAERWSGQSFQSLSCLGSARSSSNS
jgi:hypothetical protein